MDPTTDLSAPTSVELRAIASTLAPDLFDQDGPGGKFAARPVPGKETVVAWLAKATLGATLVGIVSDLAATFYHTSEVTDANERARQTTQGLAESMSPAILGFTMLALVALLAAVGQRGCRMRMDAE